MAILSKLESVGRSNSLLSMVDWSMVVSVREVMMELMLEAWMLMLEGATVLGVLFFIVLSGQEVRIGYKQVINYYNC